MTNASNQGQAVQRRHRLLAVVSACVIALALVLWFSGAWITNPILKANGDASSAEAERSRITPYVRPPPIDPKVAMLGTDSSISTKPQQLVLVATLPGRTPHDGTATLGTDPRNPQTYGAGAILANGAVIEEIYADHIVLKLGNERTTLVIGKSSISAKFAQLINSSNKALTVGGEAAVKKPLAKVASSREDMSEILRPQPVYDGERFVGLRFFAGTNRGKFEALGLRTGDTVLFIDGKPLKSPDATWQLLEATLSAGNSIVVSVERDGGLMSMYLDGARLTEEPMRASAMEINIPPPQGL